MRSKEFVVSEIASYLYRKILMDGAAIEMLGRNKFQMSIPQIVSFADKDVGFNMIVEFKIFRGKLKMILKDVQEV